MATLEKGMVVDVYTDPVRKQLKEGTATLLHRIDVGRTADALRGTNCEYWVVRIENRICERIITRE